MADSAEFDAMEAAFRETARGRWFLDEVARRARLTETDGLLDALRRIERAVTPAGGMASGLTPVSALPSDPAEAGPVAAILDAAERVQETAWTMRESGAEPGLCDRLDGASADIYAACAMLDGPDQDRPVPLDDDGEPGPDAGQRADAPALPAGLALADLARALERGEFGRTAGPDRFRVSP